MIEFKKWDDNINGLKYDQVKKEFDNAIEALGWDEFINQAVYVLQKQYKCGCRNCSYEEITPEYAINYYKNSAKALWYYFQMK